MAGEKLLAARQFLESRNLSPNMQAGESRVLREFMARREYERQQARAKRSVPFAGAAIGRLTASLSQSSQSVNADLDGALEILRARARSLCANNENGRRFLTLVANNVIGAGGPKLQVRAANPDGSLDKAANDTIEIHWDRWGKKADITGRMTLAHMQRVAAKAVARDGEALIRVVRGTGYAYGMALQVLESDRLDHTLNQQLSNGNVIRQGVEMDTAGRVVAYYIRNAHPGDYLSVGDRKLERVLANDIFHLYLPERAEQVRGYTWLHAVLMRAAMLHGFEESAVVAARVGASKVAVLTREDPGPSALESMADGKTSAGALQMSAESGEIVELPAGYGLDSWNPEYPHANFDSFLKACMRGLASGLDVATHNLSGDMTDVNYSSARIAELSERDQWMVLQGWWVDSFLMPLYEDWLGSALLRKQITFEASGKPLPVDKFDRFYNASRFQPRTWAWVDPLKEVNASKELIAARLASRTQIAAGLGREWDDILAELEAEQKSLNAAGLSAAETSQPPTEPDADE